MVMRKGLDYEVESQRKKGRPKDMEEKFEEESVKVGLRREDAFC